MKLWDCPGGFSQSKRATNCATPGYEIFQLWSNMWSTPIFDQLPARGKVLSAQVSQGFPGFPRATARTWASRSQSRRATNCATPGYEVVGWPGRILPKQARCLNYRSNFDLASKYTRVYPRKQSPGEIFSLLIQSSHNIRRREVSRRRFFIFRIGSPSPQGHTLTEPTVQPGESPAPWPEQPGLPLRLRLPAHLPGTGHKCCPHRQSYAPDG